MAKVLQRGNPINTNGELPSIGAKAPDFRLVDVSLKDISLATFKGKRKLLNIVPSLDTPTCAISTKKFNDFAKGRDDVAALTISTDLPFAQRRFCSAENNDAVKTLSIMRDKSFAKDYGVLIVEGPAEGITARAVVVLDADDKVLYSELVSDTSHEPNYEAAIAALK